MKNFISIKELSKDEIIEVLDVAKKLDNTDSEKRRKMMEGKIMTSIFFEPSTRTRLSFTSAAYKMGCQVLGFDNPDISSIKKGESLRDTIIMVSAYSDVIVMRHNIDGAARFAEEVTDCPIINAGDGANEHPSQTLLDLYTLREELDSKFYIEEDRPAATESNEHYTIVNTFKVPDEKTSVTVRKMWDDNGDKAEKRPEEVTLIINGLRRRHKYY